MIAILVPGCGTAPDVQSDDAPTAPAAGPKAPEVKGTPDKSELTDTFGVFVAPSGKANADGSLAHPFDSVSAGIALAQKVGKRVYVCAGTYREQLTIVDSISVIGSLDCGATSFWKKGHARSRIEAPASPAIRAKDITSPTRLEGLDVVAPNATGRGGSSIGLLADHAGALVIANTKITAGDATDGVDGSDAPQLLQTEQVDGERALPEGACGSSNSCVWFNFPGVASPHWVAKPVKGGASACRGRGGEVIKGEDGGEGGATLYMSKLWYFRGVLYRFWSGDTPAGGVRTGTAGTAGSDGVPPVTFGRLDADGYHGDDGKAGTDGAPGHGGSGGTGSAPKKSAIDVGDNEPWAGNSGAGGGAGGCPGLAGTGGTGGGASIAVALVESPLTLDSTELTTGRGGNAGRGVFGSDPTAGGQAGANGTGVANGDGHAGGSGGRSGISTNGSAGPSVAVMHAGPAPAMKNGATQLGRGGNGVEARSHSDALGNEKTIPATPPGVAQDVLAL
jgi:hypothetical protein